jgi:hypothetical protein
VQKRDKLMQKQKSLSLKKLTIIKKENLMKNDNFHKLKKLQTKTYMQNSTTNQHKEYTKKRNFYSTSVQNSPQVIQVLGVGIAAVILRRPNNKTKPNKESNCRYIEASVYVEQNVAALQKAQNSNSQMNTGQAQCNKYEWLKCKVFLFKKLYSRTSI